MLKFFVILMLLGASAGVQGASEDEEGAPNDPSRLDYDLSQDPLALAARGLTRTDTVGSGSFHMAAFPFGQPDDDDDDDEEAAVARPAVPAASSSAESVFLRRELHLAEAAIEALRRANALSEKIWRERIAAENHAAAEEARAEERERSKRKIGTALGREAATSLLLAEEQRGRAAAEEEAASLRAQVAALEKALEAARAAGPAAATPPRAAAAAAPTPPTRRKRRPRLKLRRATGNRPTDAAPAPAGRPAKRRSDGRHVGHPRELAHPRGTRAKPANNM